MYTSSETLHIVLASLHGKDRKLIPTNAGNNVRSTKSLSEHRSSLDQGLVSFLVAKGVIDLLQVVKIDKEQ